MQTKQLKNKVLISACLCGVKCRYDGKHKSNQHSLELIKNGQAIAICPEILAGLSIPRPAADIINGKVIEKNGRDVTDVYQKGAQLAYKFCQDNNIKISKAILKNGSPSCGKDGLFTKLLQSKGIVVEHQDKT